MKTYIKTITLSLASILLLNSCTEEDATLDTTKPEIILGSPTDHQEYELGDTIEVQAILKDNEELGAYKIEIHSAGDGHDHGNGDHEHKIAVLNDDHDHDHEAWGYNEEGTIYGKEYILNKPIQIPDGEIEEGKIYNVEMKGYVSQEDLKTLLGHKKSEVFIGGLSGIVLATIVYSII